MVQVLFLMSVTVTTMEKEKKETIIILLWQFLPFGRHSPTPAVFLLYSTTMSGTLSLMRDTPSKNHYSIKMFFRQECHFSKLIMQILNYLLSSFLQYLQGLAQ